MSGFWSFVTWAGIMLAMLFIVRWIPPQEHYFRTVVALTWLLWLLVGFCYSIRFFWRFLRG